MRNLKKFLALVLAMLMVVSATAAVSAFDDVDSDSSYIDAIEDLVEKGIVNGVGDDKFNPTGLVERYQMALMMARALNPAESDWQAGMAIFNDVTEWYGAIAFAYMEGIVTGIGGGNFAPKDGIKYQDALIMAVRALGYKVDVSGDPYWLAAYQLAEKLGLTDNVAVNKGDQTLTRAETAQVIYNMLYATPADGGATIAAKNFGEATPENTTTFVITATAKQAYADSYKAAEAGYVGVQALVNGLPSGDVMYLPAAVLGIDEDEVEDYFSYAFDFVNYNAKNGSFDRVIPGLEPVVVYNIDVTKNSSTKITVDGTAYYPVDQITGAALKNEIVVFSGGELASAAKMLLTNKDGDIVNYNGTVVATFAYETATGAKYYVDQDVSAGTTRVITEAAALAKYGVEIDDGTYTKYATLTADSLTGIGTYQLKMFDDDRDGKFERAIATKVFMSVYQAKDSNGAETLISPMKGIKSVTYTEALAKGNVFAYTYNEQTKVVDVIEVLAAQYGTIKKLDLTNYKANTDAAKNMLAKVTIDSTVYTVGNNDRMNELGAALQVTATAPSSFADIANNARISFTDINKFYNIGSPVRFYAYNNVVVYAETYAIEDAFSYMVVNELATWDVGSFTVDAYVDGVKGAYTISKIYDINGYIDLSEVNSLKFSSLLNNFYNNCAGKVYKTVKLSDGTYQISANLVLVDDIATPTVNEKAVSLNSFKLYEAPVHEYKFSDGITDIVDTKENRIRTNANTKFFFIDTTTNEVSIYTGTLANNFVIKTGASVYADKLGYGDVSAKNGVAGTVIVYYSNANQVEGFNLTSITNAFIYIANPGQYTVDTAANLGLTDKTGVYYDYGTVAVNLSNGTNLKVYSQFALTRGYYVVDGLGIARELTAVEAARIVSVDLTKAQVDLADQYFNIPGVTAAGSKVTTLITVDYKDLGSKKTNNKDHFAAEAKKAVFLTNDLNDGIVVLIVGSDAPVVSTNAVNAKWTAGDNKEWAAIAKNIVTADYKITGDAFIAFKANSAVPFNGYGVEIADATAWTGLKTSDYTFDANALTITKNGNNFVGTFSASLTIKDGVASFAIDSLKDVNNPFETNGTKFDAGNYLITLKFVAADSSVSFFTIPVVVK